ncbi:MAG: AAA family ATPase [Butyrivibrio sp.]|nr:AAA family ATPase [Acetatifactor muris]MCM1557987.1 AAA family ATPase [Butyrivibrio sp.]
MKNTDRKSEERYLRDTMQVIADNLENYGGEVSRMQGEIDEMLEHYHDNDVELWTLLNNTITLHDHMKRAMERNQRATQKPYFGRIIFRDETLGTEESLYIGKGGISKDNTHWIVVDWRAPVANAYYENGLGNCSYAAPEGKEIPIDLKLKRTFEIAEGKLLDFFDTEVVANDDLLMKYLSKNKEAVLGEIVATIQKEQNEIIRKSPYHNVIVQGVAGSGKTTVAMHRISYILYNYRERFKPEDFYIVGSNRILLNYITGVLPDLDVYGVRQMTMEQLFIRLLYEDWDDKRYSVKSVSGYTGAKRIVSEGTVPEHTASERIVSKHRDVIRGTEEWYLDLEAFIRELEWNTIRRESVYLDPRQFVEGLENGRNGIYDRREEDEKAGIPPRPVCLAEGAAVERYITQNPTVSIQSKINMLNERLVNKIKEEFLGKGVKYTEGEKKAILQAYRGYYGGRQWKKSIYELYAEFLAGQWEKYGAAFASSRQGASGKIVCDSGTSEGQAGAAGENAFDVYDLAALALLYKRVKETEVISEAHHIVIDEAQDFGMMAYRVLHACIRDCTYTVMGDVSQNIHFGFGLSDWEALKALLLPDPMDSFGVLRKSYRNTVEISEFATNILRHGSFSVYPVEPIIRHGNQVAVEQLAEDVSAENLAERAAGICRRWQEQGCDTIAVVCRNAGEAGLWAGQLAKHIEIMESDLEKASFGKGIMVLPVEYTKGLEFDAVLILNPTRKAYPVDDGHAKLLYVAATRALHELHILCRGDLTGLISASNEPSGCIGIRLANDARVTYPDAISCSTPHMPASGLVIADKAPERTARTVQGPVPEADGTGKGTGTDAVSSGTKRKAVVSVKQKTAAPSKNIGATPATITDSHISSKGVPEEKPSGPQETACAFGDMPATEQLRPRGHSKINLAVKWVSKQADGLYLQSQYGTLRISPVGSGIIRTTFARGTVLKGDAHPLIAVQKAGGSWKYRDSGRLVELTTGEVTVQIEKASGAVQYLDAKGAVLLSERRQESRQCDEKGSWLFLELQKGEQLFAMGPAGQGGLKLRGGARYISTGEGLPFLLSDKGYGILPASSGPVISCDIPAYGTYLYLEGQGQQDYYFVAGKQQQNIINAYKFLCGDL